jgi:hypothetical protein
MATGAQMDIAPLLVPGILGFFTHFEVTEIFATIDGQSGARNVLTIAVAEERDGAQDESLNYLGPRIRLKSLPRYAFGVQRYLRPIHDLVPALDRLDEANSWEASGIALACEPLNALRRKFVSPDATEPTPLNHVLKNNFWNGSHILEWADRTKTNVRPLLDKPILLQELAREINKVVPIGLDAVSDRLGHVLVQLPVRVLIADFHQSRGSDFYIETVWHSKATPRPLRASCGVEQDGSVLGYASVPSSGDKATLPMNPTRGLHRGFLWDDDNQLLLAATGPRAFVNSIAFQMMPITPEPRVFTIKQAGGNLKQERIAVTATMLPTIIGETENDDTGGWTGKRLYLEQGERVARERSFVQYRPTNGRIAEERVRALADIRFLIGQHGGEGVWLWDPYLTAHDVLETLFFSRHSHSDLRALTAGREIEAQESDFVDAQRQELGEVQSNWHGLRLEYRIRSGQAGWVFHDRFLIFPRSRDGALAWSLGTSVNSLGHAHHILQKVGDGQRVMDAFVELWDLLSAPEHLIWKKA